MNKQTAYVELILTLERELETLNDKSIPEQARYLRSCYDAKGKEWISEMYTRRTYHRAINDVLGIARKARQRRQDRAAVLFNGAGDKDDDAAANQAALKAQGDEGKAGEE